MSKTNKVLLVAVIVLFVALIGLVVWNFFINKSPYYAVFLRTGDIYFGKLVRFPYFGLKNVYTIQVNPQNQQNPVSIQKFSNVFWGPEDWLKLNREEVVWMTRLREDSQLVQLFKTNPNLTPPPQAQQPPQPPAQPPQQPSGPEQNKEQKPK
jgi:hypothetical protein